MSVAARLNGSPPSKPEPKEIKMEYAKIENAQLETTVNEATDTQLRELNNLQLAYVGGGTIEWQPA